MDRSKKWRATYRIICPLPKDDVPLKLDAIEEERVSVVSSSSNRKESILTTIDPQDDEDAVSDAITTENTATQLTTTATPSRAGSWLKPRVDYHPSSASKNAIKFNTIDSSQTKMTQVTRSQTRTYSWIERHEERDDSLSEMTNSTVYTDKNPRIMPMRFTQETQPISPSFQRRFGTNTSVTTAASSSHHIRISKTKLIILSIVIILVLCIAIVLLVIFL